MPSPICPRASIFWDTIFPASIRTSLALTLAGQGADAALNGEHGDHGHHECLRLYRGLFHLRYPEDKLDVDVGLVLLGKTRAAVAEAWGEWTGGEGRVVWQTSSEWNTAGFFVYRVDPETGAETRLSGVLVPAAFQAAGATYERADPAATEGGGGTWLEEVELTGGLLELGTHGVVFGAPRPRAEAVKTTSAKALASPKLSGPSPILKVTVRNEGFYAVLAQAIADEWASRLQTRSPGRKPASWKSPLGVAVPAICVPIRARLVFHGRGADGWYARDNAYLDCAGRGRRDAAPRTSTRLRARRRFAGFGELRSGQVSLR